MLDPVYPVYVDTNVMGGRSGEFDPVKGGYANITYLPAIAENGFVPELPKEPVDAIYLCYPNNPKTQVEVSKEIGISQAQVSRLEKNALKQLEKYIGS